MHACGSKEILKWANDSDQSTGTSPFKSYILNLNATVVSLDSFPSVMIVKNIFSVYNVSGESSKRSE